MTAHGSVPRQMAVIFVLSAGLALLYNAFSPRGIPLIRREMKNVAAADSLLFGGKNSLPPAIVRAPLHEQALRQRDSALRVGGRPRESEASSPLAVISLKQFRRLMEEQRPLVLDARSGQEYAKGHIPGSHNIPSLEVEAHFGELAQVPRDTLIVIYCNNPECHMGRMLADFMSVMEFRKLYLYDDGWDGWTKAGLPADTTLP
jgi:rhodanese-related sulfurtransferase